MLVLHTHTCLPNATMRHVSPWRRPCVRVRTTSPGYAARRQATLSPGGSRKPGDLFLTCANSIRDFGSLDSTNCSRCGAPAILICGWKGYAKRVYRASRDVGLGAPARSCRAMSRATIHAATKGQHFVWFRAVLASRGVSGATEDCAAP